MPRNWIHRVLVAVVVALFIGACGTYEPDNTGDFSRADEIKPGPGIFTGEDGKWIIFSN